MTERRHRPRVTLRCPASQHDAPEERTIEFGHGLSDTTHAGGLINLARQDDKLVVCAYACDPNVEVQVGRDVRYRPSPEACRADAAEHEFWVLHSPYPDRTWRGVEKCIGAPSDGPLLFPTREDAERHITEQSLGEFVPVRVFLSTPLVRRSSLEEP